MLKTLLVSNSCFSILCYLLLLPAILFVVAANTAVKVQFGFLTVGQIARTFIFLSLRTILKLPENTSFLMLPMRLT